MRFILGLVIFWISIFGYLLLFKKKTKIPSEFSLPIIFTLVGILMFLAGILNIMKEITILICLIGMIYFCYSLVKKEINYKSLLNPNFIILAFIFLYFTIICSNMHLVHYDNFSHWGLIVKTIFMKNALPNFENTLIEFKDYQPGSACFIYFLGLLIGKKDSSMIIAQNYLLIAYFFSLLIFTKETNKNDIKENYFLKILLIVSYLFVMFGNISFNDLLVDTLIAVMSICSVGIIYYFRNDLKSAFIYTLPISIYLFLVKNIGIVLVCFNCLGLLYVGFKNKKIKKSLIYAFVTGIVSTLFFYIWSKHVSYVYGDLSMYSKHALSTSNILSELKNKGWSKIFEFCNIYLNHFFDILENIPHKYMIIINILILILIIIYKNDRKKTIKFLIMCDFLYLIYYAILGVMYLLSMPWGEASYLAGFDRYMLTIIFLIIGLFLIYFMRIIKNNKDNKKVSFVLIFCLIFISIFINFKYYISDYKMFLGDQDFENTRPYKFDKILNSEIFSANYNDYYYVYAPISSNNDSGYVYYLSVYKLNTDKCLVVKEINQFDTPINDSYNKKIIILDQNNEILNYIEKNNYKKISNKLYMKNS